MSITSRLGGSGGCMVWGGCNGFRGTWTFPDKSNDYIKAFCKSPARRYILHEAAGMRRMPFVLYFALAGLLSVSNTQRR